MSTRQQNEQKYSRWEDLPDGGRRYWADRQGRMRGRARYVKIVDSDEQTISFVQEIYDEADRLIARHQKYPVDTGHQALTDEDMEENA
jgi:hypothetical protein